MGPDEMKGCVEVEQNNAMRLENGIEAIRQSIKRLQHLSSEIHGLGPEKEPIPGTEKIRSLAGLLQEGPDELQKMAEEIREIAINLHETLLG